MMSSAIVTSLTWVRRGVAKPVPDKVELSKDELQALIDESQRTLQGLSLGADDDDDEEGGVAVATEGDEEWEDVQDGARGKDEVEDFYNLDDYDQPDASQLAGSEFHNFAVHMDNNDDPFITIKDTEEDEDDKEDLNIKPTDNMVVVGKALEHYTNLEVYVYNEEDGVLYVHHDILLSSFPLALEWLNFDPMEQQPGNLVAIGNMTPVIDIWDLDIINAVEPAFCLGKKIKKSKKKPAEASTQGHVDSVLDLSWNRHLGHGLASASADHSILLWDLAQRQAITVLNRHTDKVQTLEWHPFEMQSLLSGGFDGRINASDCRSADSFKTWSIEGEVERVLWNHYNPFTFLASSDKGFVYSFDIRSDKPLFTLHAHEQATTGLTLCPTIPDFLVTCSADNSYKLWDIKDNQPALVVSKDPKMGIINNVVFSPDSPFLVAMGGERDSLRLMDLAQHAPVMNRFGDRQQAPVIPHPSQMAARGQSLTSQGASSEQDADDMGAMATGDADTMETGSEASSSAASSSSKNSKKKKKKKKKKPQESTG